MLQLQHWEALGGVVSSIGCFGGYEAVSQSRFATHRDRHRYESKMNLKQSQMQACSAGSNSRQEACLDAGERC